MKSRWQKEFVFRLVTDRCQFFGVSDRICTCLHCTPSTRSVSNRFRYRRLSPLANCSNHGPFKIRNNRSTYVAIGDSMDSLDYPKSDYYRSRKSDSLDSAAERRTTFCRGVFVSSSVFSFFFLLALVLVYEKRGGKDATLAKSDTSDSLSCIWSATFLRPHLDGTVLRSRDTPQNV